MLPFRMFLIRMFPVRVFPDRMFRFCIMHKNDIKVNILKAQILIHQNNLETALHP